MNRRKFATTLSAFAALLPLSVFAGKGWCRSDPIVRVDGQTYSITGFAHAKKAAFHYFIGYAEDYKVIMLLPDETMSFVESEGFFVEVRAFDESGNEVESYVTIREIGS